MKRILQTAAMLAALAASALAGDGFEAPKVENPSYWVSVAVAAGAALGIAVVGFKSSKRTHLD